MSERDLRQLQSLLELGGGHEEGVEHGHSLREHGDLQFVLVLRGEGGGDNHSEKQEELPRP